MNIAVLGAGAWGSALAIHCAHRHAVTLWTRDASHAEEMCRTHANTHYLGDLTFPPSLKVTPDLAQALHATDLVLSAVPTAGFRQILRDLRAAGCNAPLVWANKGLENGSSRLMVEVAAEELPAGQLCGAFSGPSFAGELACGLPTAMTLAAVDDSFSRSAASALHGGNVRVYSSNDVVGVSVGGALKNVMAIAAGISDGMGFGNNARAALITRGLAEITRFGLALGGRLETFMGLTGAGDLILTCTGDASRNRTVGLRLAGGETLTEIVASLGHVAEGVHTTREVCQRARELGVEMPITRVVHRVLSENLAPRVAVEMLLSREQKAEHY